MITTKPYDYQLDGQVHQDNDDIITGRQILTNAGLTPASDFVLITIGNRTSQSIGLEEKVSLCKNEASVFLSFKSDRTFRLTINEREYVWGAEEISTAEIRQYARIPDEHELILDSDGDKIIKDSGNVHLTSKGVERILSRLPEKVCITVNTREKKVDPGTLSFMELIQLAFPKLTVNSTTEATVNYRKGHDDCPEGTLIKSESIQLKQGMVFHVTATDKS